jgi:hypothetical protein
MLNGNYQLVRLMHFVPTKMNSFFINREKEEEERNKNFTQEPNKGG